MYDIIHTRHAFHVITDLVGLLLQQRQVGTDDTQFDIISGRSRIWFQDTEPVNTGHLDEFLPDLVDDLVRGTLTCSCKMKIHTDNGRDPFFYETFRYRFFQVDNKLDNIAAGFVAIEVDDADADIRQ